MALPRLYATAVDCAHELIKEEPGIKGEAGQILQINKRGALNKVGEGGKKRNN